jgi:hypothetical protein
VLDPSAVIVPLSAVMPAAADAASAAAASTASAMILFMLLPCSMSTIARSVDPKRRAVG